MKCTIMAVENRELNPDWYIWKTVVLIDNASRCFYSYVATTNKFMQLLRAGQFFTCREWKIENGNVRELMSKLSSTDKKVSFVC